MTATLLSEVTNNLLEFPDKDGKAYQIKFARTDVLVLNLGFDAHKTAVHSLLNHDRIIAAIPAIHEYKHYNPIQGKFWTQHAGINLCIAIPGNLVSVEHFEGYSYPKVTINGETITLNVGGVTGGNTVSWIDHVGAAAETCVNLKAVTVKKLLEVAIPASEFDTEGYGFNVSKYFNAETWRDLVARHTVKVVKGLKLVLRSGFSYGGSKRYFVADEPKRGGKAWHTVFEGEGLPTPYFGSPVTVKLSQVDFLETAKANGIEVLEPGAFTRVPVSALVSAE